MPSLPDATLRPVKSYAMQMGPDERRLWLLVELDGGEKHQMGPYDREALVSVMAMLATGSASADMALLADPETDAIRIACDGYTDDQVAAG